MPRRSNPTAGQSGKILSPRSSVWQFMELNRETRRAKCQFCDKILAYTGGTTNLRYHLTAAHSMQEFEVVGPSAKVFKPGKIKSMVGSSLPAERKKRGRPKIKGVKEEEGTDGPSTSNNPTLSTANNTSTEVANPATQSAVLSTKHQPSGLSAFRMRFSMNRSFTDNQNAIVHEKLLQMLVQSLQPLSFVVSEGFQGLMKFLEPAYPLPDKKLLQDMLLNMYEAGKVKLMSTLAEDAPHYSVVYDLWRNNDQECYMTVIIHYLNDQWERKSWVLGTEQLSQLRVTGNEIGNCISSLLLMYNLPLQGLVGTVYRQGMLKSQMGRIGTLLACESMSCAAEKLDMCVQAAFAIPEIRDVIDKAGKLANYLIHDDGARRILQEMKEVDGFTHQVELVQDHKGSWVATCNMLMKLIALKEEIEKVGDQDIKNKQLYLSEEKWALIELLMNSLQILKAALTVMSEDKTGSVSCLLPVVHSILQHCEDSSHAKNSPMDNFLKTIGKETREKWDLTAILPSSIPMLAALLDPRFKKLKFIAEEDKGDVFDALKGVLGTIKVGGTDGTTNSNSQDLSPFLCLFGGTEEYTQERQDTDSEITNYINFPMLRHECCPLDWWRVNQGRFPELAKLARQYLSVPAIALPVKEIRAGACQLDMKRGLLEVEAAGPLIFMNHNWALY